MKSDPELDPDPLVRGTDPGILDPDPHQNVLVPNIDNKTFISLRTYQMYTHYCTYHLIPYLLSPKAYSSMMGPCAIFSSRGFSYILYMNILQLVYAK